jgi:hypothetical protein
VLDRHLPTRSLTIGIGSFAARSEPREVQRTDRTCRLRFYREQRHEAVIGDVKNP